MEPYFLTKLTPYQATFYHEWMLNPSRSDYNIIMDQSMSGPMDIERLNTSLVRFINNHLLANSNVINQSDELFWKQRPPLSEDTQILNFLCQEPSQEEILRFALHPFDLEKDQLFRFYAIKLNNDRHRIIYIAPHILVDGLSAVSIYNELANYYNDPNYVALISVKEQAILHNELNSRFDNILSNGKEMSKFWEKHLRNVNNVGFKFLQNSDVSNTKSSLVSSISEFRFEFTGNIFDNVGSLAQSYGLSPFMYGQLILAILLHRISGTDNFVISYPVGIKEGQDPIFGSHVNTLLKAYSFTTESTLNDLINQSVEYISELKQAKANYLPIREIIRNTSGSDLLEFAFAQTNLKDIIIPYDGIHDVIIHSELNIDLLGKILFEQEIRNGQLNYRVKYNHLELDTELVDNFIDIYKSLFTIILEDLLEGKTNHLISSYSLLNEKNYESLIEGWNDTFEKYDTDTTIHELFENQVIKTPDHIALIYKDIQLSYRELNEASNQLAHYLLEEHKIRPDELVLLHFTRSEKMLIAILGILKAGAGYVPIDLGYPAERVEHIIKDTETRFVLVEENTIQGFYDYNLGLKNDKDKIDLSVISLDHPTMISNLERFSVENPFTETGPNNLAYVIYTSGTTGQPKGVMIEHIGVTNLIPDSYSRYQLESKDVILQSANFVFDTSVEQIFLAILNGNTLFLVEERSYLEEDAFIKYLSDHNVSYINFTPSILEKLDVTQVKSLRTLDSGGERLSNDLYNKLKDKHFRFINSYGVTEATVTSIVNTGNGTNNMGRPIRNTSVYVLDKNLLAVPVGAIGELYIGGNGVARGYLNLPEITSERFLLNPFQSVEEKKIGYNGRIYKTGDLVRYLPGGNLEYIGRNDFQIKIRGYRIELEEIENALLKYEGISQVVVLAKENNSGSKYLAAYYISDNIISREDLSIYLSRKLPDYMLPSVYTHLDEFPITINGKLDISSLPEPFFQKEVEYIAPKTRLQQQLVAIYGEILGLNPDTISIHDDFFRLGGDSIVSIQLVSLLRKQMSVYLNIKEIFTCKTVQKLSELIESGKLEESTLICTEQGILGGVVPLLPIQEWFFYQVEDCGNLPEFNHWNQSFLINVPELDENILKQSLSLLLERHDALRMYYIRTDSGYIQKYKEEVITPPISILDRTGINDNAMYDMFTEWQSNFDINTPPLFHIGYIKGYEEGRARIYFAFHHLIGDAVSWRILTEDLRSIYYSLKDGISKKISKGSSYRQWSEAIKNYKTEDSLEREKEILYWREIIKHVKQYNISLDQISFKEKNSAELVLDTSYTQRLLRFSHHTHYTQINDLLLSAVSMALWEFTGVTSNFILFESHGRESTFHELDVTETVGWFTAMYPVALQAGTDISTTIAYTKKSLRSIPNKGIGYGKLIGYVEHEMPKVIFNYLGQLSQQENGGANWYIATEYSGNSIGKRNKDSDIINITGAVANDKLQFIILGYLTQDQAQYFAGLFEEKLKKIIDQCFFAYK